MKHIITLLFLGMALVHFLPALSVFAPSRMASLYGIAPGDTALTTLLHHRALMFSILFAGFIIAAFTPAWRWPVLIIGIISMAGFIVIAALHGELSGGLRKIVIADVVGLIFAALAVITLFKS